jgi:hypothetical protein
MGREGEGKEDCSQVSGLGTRMVSVSCNRPIPVRQESGESDQMELERKVRDLDHSFPLFCCRLHIHTCFSSRLYIVYNLTKCMSSELIL